MSPTKRAFVVLAVAGSTWWLASWWLISTPERFYVSVPLATLAFVLSGYVRQEVGVLANAGPAADRLKAELQTEPSLATRLRSGLFLIVALIILVVCTLSWQFGPHVLNSWRFWAEVSIAFYFLAAFFIVLMGFLRLLLMGTERLSRRLRCAPVFGTAAALALFFVMVLPLGIAFSFVFRFKVPNLADPKRDLGRAYEDVEFASADGTTLRGWWIPAKTPSSRTLVICHGLAANRTLTLPFYEVGDWLDANVFMFDLRGHGDSAGRTISMGHWEKDDVLAAIAYVRRHHPGEARQVVGLGQSLGAAALAEAASMVEPALTGVILDSGFVSTEEMTRFLPGPPVLHPWLLAIGLPVANWHAGCSIMNFCPEASIGRLRAPVVFLHSRHDHIVPSDHSVRLFEHAAEPKQLLIFEIGGHSNGFFAEREKYRAAIGKLAEQMR